MTLVHLIYAHPAARSFTRDVFEAFRRGPAEAGHSATVSDLYAMGAPAARQRHLRAAEQAGLSL